MENHFNCIYCYTNKINGKKYVGQTINFNIRHYNHCNNSFNEKDSEYNNPFHRAIRKYGIENFIVEILKEDLEDYDEMNYWEDFYIIEFNTLRKNGKGYNIARGGNNGNNFAGKTEEEMAEFRRKCSERMKGKWSGENNPNYGGKNSGKNKGKKMSDEQKKKLSESRKGKYKCENNGFYGQHHTEESRKKMSESKKGKYEGEKHPRATKVAQLDKDTKKIIKIWDYIYQIEKEMGIKYRTLHNYLTNKRKTHEYKGFLWYYADEITK